MTERTMAPKAKKSRVKTKSKTSQAKRKTTQKKSPARKKKPAAKSKPKSRAATKKKTTRQKAPSAKRSKPKAAPRKSGKAKVSAKTVSRARAAVEAATQRSTESSQRAQLKTKPLSRKFLEELAQAIKKAVAPAIESLKGREVVGQAYSGDMTFELDRIAEKALMQHLRVAKKPVAYYSEDNGYTTFTSGQPTNLLVIDPIDGTRAAKNGFEGCMVSVCSTRVIERPTYGDLDNAYILDLVGNKAFYAERGQGAKFYVGGHNRKIKLSDNHDLEELSWAMSVPARPADLTFPTAARLIDLSSLKGGFFACNSSTYSLSRLVSSQLDAYVDFANRYHRDLGVAVEDHFINAGRGSVVGVYPYDFVGALLVAQEAGAIVTDAYGNGFDHVLLLDSTVSNQRSIIAAANPVLYEKLFSFFDTRIQQYETLLQKRYDASQ